MCEQHQHSVYCGRLGRRNFLKVTGSATALGIFGGGFLVGNMYIRTCVKAQRAGLKMSRAKS